MTAPQLRPLPVRTERIDFSDDYEGFYVTVWMNPPQYLIDDINSAERKYQALGTLIRESNMADADGNPLDFTSEETWTRILPIELGVVILNRYIDAFNTRARLPKVNGTPSSSS